MMAGGVLCYICPLRVPNTLKLFSKKGEEISKRTALMFSGVNFDSAVVSRLATRA